MSKPRKTAPNPTVDALTAGAWELFLSGVEDMNIDTRDLARRVWLAMDKVRRPDLYPEKAA